MAVFISVTTNAFEDEFERQRSGGRAAGMHENVRRPLRGIEIKNDTYAILKVRTHTGQDIPLVSSSAKNETGLDTSYSNFIVQSITEQRAEKQQIVETFGEDFIFFFGERPRMLNVNGVLLNTNDFNWKSEFWHNYENHLRGTKLAEANARLYMFFDDVVVEGYMLQAESQGTSGNPYHLPFQFQLFITNYAILSQVQNVFIPEHTLVFEREAADIPLLDQTLSTGDTSLLTSGAGQTGGGLNSFLSATGGSGLANTADFNIARTLENIRNTYYGINVPSGIGSQIRPAAIQNRGAYLPGERGLPIHRNHDEYPESSGPEPEFDRYEIERQHQELALQSGDELEKQARTQLEALGIDTSRREVSALLIGRGAFAATKMIGSFGMRQADGELTLPV